MIDKILSSLDILTGLTALVALCGLGAIGALWSGLRLLRTAGSVRFFRARRQQLVRGWRMIAFSLVLAGIAIVIRLGGEPAASSLLTLSPTPSISPTASVSPTITIPPSLTVSPTITTTPSESGTPTASPTAHIPLAVEAQFTGLVTPNPEAVFSPITFARGINSAYEPIGPGLAFSNPMGRLYALFSYDQMFDGSQWTALWYRTGTLVYFETKPWDGGTGGLGYSDWNPDPEEWLAGVYQVQIFVGVEFKIAGEFTLVGDPPTRTATPTASQTPTPTLTPVPTRTPLPTDTRWPTDTPSAATATP